MNALPATAAAQAEDHPHSHVLEAAERAARRIAPLWPLRNFVAVNPFLGLTDHPFPEAAGVMSRSAGARMFLPRRSYKEAIAAGRITDADLEAALAGAGSWPGCPRDPAALKTQALQEDRPAEQPLPTLADVIGETTGLDCAGLVTDRVSFWAAGYFDDGQAAWASPWRKLPPYAAWREEAMRDRTPEIMGLSGFRAAVARLPAEAGALLDGAASRLGLAPDLLEAYFHRLLMTVAGWAGYARYRLWQSELQGQDDATLIELLAVRLGWELALLEAGGMQTEVVSRWQEAVAGRWDQPAADRARHLDAILQDAYERAWQREVFAKLTSVPQPTATAGRKAVQASFCIDVRSEVFRRALESLSPEIETLGFAGFFGFPIEYVPLGHRHGNAQCPVLLTPKFTVCESVRDADAEEEREILNLRLLRRRGAKAWKSFKLAAVSCFAFVEAMGWTYLAKLASDALGLTRTVPQPRGDGIDPQVRSRLRPEIAAGRLDGRDSGFTPAAKVDMAESVLKAMSMTDGFARVVLLVGHGASTVNNPHASGLDCGACGGHTGEANARVAAAILNDAEVRAALTQRGIEIPEDTLFLGCLHDTTTDEVTVFDTEDVPPARVGEMAQLRRWLAAAGTLARTERARRLNIAAMEDVDKAIISRSRDWSQVRPEWGLAGCAAFIAAPRDCTQGLDLAGRAFLHSYDWRQDRDFRVLELIMTAPMVVASWISLQYYGSTVDNRIFGAGNKALHNVSGLLGVLEGNGGDLRTGLPWQALHDGNRLIHEPLRLSVVIAAPVSAINAVIAKHDQVRQLVDNGWLHLFALGEAGEPLRRYRGSLAWQCEQFC